MRNLAIECKRDDRIRQYLPDIAKEAVIFILKQLWASLFGVLFLIIIILTSVIWQDQWALHRYDALFIFAITTQILFLVFKLESLREAKVILLFHIVGTIMEIYKLRMGSLRIPGQCGHLFR